MPKKPSILGGTLPQSHDDVYIYYNYYNNAIIQITVIKHLQQRYSVEIINKNIIMGLGR